MTAEERRKRLIELGYDPEQYDWVTPEEAALEDTTQLGALGTSAASAIGPTIGGLLGAAAPVVMGLGGPIGLGVGLGAGLLGGYLGGKAQETIEGASLSDENLRDLQLSRQAAFEKYPTTSLVGQFGPSLLALRPSLTTIKSLPGAIKNAPTRTQTALERYALTNAGLGGGVEAGIEAGTQAFTQDEFDFGRIATAGLLGSVLTEPTKRYRSALGIPDRPLADKVRNERGELVDNPDLVAELKEKRTAFDRRVSIAKEELEATVKEASKPEKQPVDSVEDTKQAEKMAADSVKDLEAEREKVNAEGNRAEAEANRLMDLNPTRGSADDIAMREAGAQVKKSRERLVEIEEQLQAAYKSKSDIREDTRQQKIKAEALWNKTQRKNFSKEDQQPPDKDLLNIAKGLAAKQGVRWEDEVVKLSKRAKRADKYRGEYDVNTHTAQLTSLARRDTPWHEYLHGLWQVLRQSTDPKNRKLLNYIQKDLFKDDPKFKKDPNFGEEQIVERAGIILEERMRNAPKDFIGKVKRWFDDVKLERESRKYFQPAEGELNDTHLTRMAEWLAMRGERQPSMQPRQLELFLDNLPVRHANDGLNIAEKPSVYATEAGGLPEEIDADTAESVCATLLEAEIGEVKKPKTYTLDPDKRLQRVKKERFYSDEELEAKFNELGKELERQHPELKNRKVKAVNDAKKIFLKINQDHRRLQKVTAEELNDALVLAAKYDPKMKSRYTKRVREKMAARIKSGTYTVEQGQKALARFASKPFPSEMGGEDIAKVVNGMKLYHGTNDIPSILQEGFRGEELSPSSIAGRGIYMTPSKKDAEVYGESLTLTTNFKNVIDLSNETPIKTTKEYVEAGYDGATFMYGDRREIVAFREPFEEASNQLTEYFSGKRLQGVDDYFKQIRNYQLTSFTDHFSTNPSAKRVWITDSIIDRIRGMAKSEEERFATNLVADAFDAAQRDANRLEGEFIEGFHIFRQGDIKLSKEDAEHVAKFMVFTRRNRASEIPADTLARYNEPNSPVRVYVEYFKSQYKEVRDRQKAAGMKLTRSDGTVDELGQDPNYYPEMISQEMRRELSGEAGAAQRQKREKELADYWFKNQGKDDDGNNILSEADTLEAASAYVSKLTGSSDFIGSTHFAALRKAEGIGLPPTIEDGKFLWIDNSAANTYTRYMRRFSRDFAFFKNVESKGDVRMFLGIRDQDGNPPVITEEAQKINPFQIPRKLSEQGNWEAKSKTTDKNVRDFLRAYLGYYEGQELFGRTANRVVVSHWLGLMSGIRDFMSAYIHALPYMRLQDIPAIVSSMKDFSKSWKDSHLYGVNKSNVNRLEFATETSNKIADGFNRWADWMSVASLRSPLERSTRAFQFGLGRMVALQQLAARADDVTANRTLARLQQMSGVDVKELRGRSNSVSDDELNKLAAAWVELNQGTYDARGVPNYTLYGPMSMFTSLARWNIEKLNRMRKDVMAPAIEEGDFRPLIKATLGTVFTGVLLQEIAEFVNNKFSYNPTLLESVKEGDNEETMYALADTMNQVGYFGIASAVINDVAVGFLKGERLDSGGVIFPAFDFFSNTLNETLFDANDAVREGADFWPTYLKAVGDILTSTTQTLRIISNQTLKRQDLEDQNARRDLRMFRRFEGIRPQSQPAGVGNRYMRPDTREFKESKTVQEAFDTLPAAFDEQIERADGRADKLKNYTTGLYTIPDKTMPSVKTPEGVEEFLRYRDYIMRQRGGGRWDKILDQWARNNKLTATKKALVKGYVELLYKQAKGS